MRIVALLPRSCPILALALAGLVGWTAPARASCGDYVVIGQGQSAMGHLERTHSSPAPHTPARPCSGPNCRGEEPIPPLGTDLGIILKDRTAELVIVVVASFQEDQAARGIHKIAQITALIKIAGKFSRCTLTVLTDFAENLVGGPCRLRLHGVDRSIRELRN